MDNKKEPTESQPESTSGDEELPGEESLVTKKTEELTRVNTRLVELERILEGKDSEITSLKQTREELEGTLVALNSSLAKTVNSYKALLVQANPEVIGELISGDTIESINESLEKAKTLVSKVRKGLEVEISRTRVPAGAPERTPPDLSSLSPREKIQYAIGSKK